MYLAMPGLILTGLIFLWPELAPDHVFGLDGLLPIAVAHYLIGLIIVLFMIGHIYLGTTGVTVTSLFKMMITGWHEHEHRAPRRRATRRTRPNPEPIKPQEGRLKNEKNPEDRRPRRSADRTGRPCVRPAGRRHPAQGAGEADHRDSHEGRHRAEARRARRRRGVEEGAGRPVHRREGHPLQGRRRHHHRHAAGRLQRRHGVLPAAIRGPDRVVPPLALRQGPGRQVDQG